MSKGKKALKVIGIIFGSLIALIIAVNIILNIVFGIQLRNKIAELKSQGKPMTIAEIAPPLVPDEENAALLYNKAFILMTTGEGGKPYIPNKESGEKNKMIKIITDVKSFSDISQWTDEQRNEIPKLINSRDMQYIYELLEEGSQKPKCNFNPNYEDGPAMLLPHIERMRNATRLLCIKALLEAESGNVEKAFDTLIVGLKFSNHLKDEPILISQLVRVACDGIIIECIKGISDSKGIMPEQATLIMNELFVHEGKEPFVKCMDVERVAFGGWGFEKILQGKTEGTEIPTPLVILGKPIFKKDFTCYLTLLSKMQDNYNLPYYEAAQDISIDQELQLAQKRFYILTALLLPSFDIVQQRATEHQANIDVCRVGLALKIYKAKNGTYPETLSKLVPDFLNEIPIDPFSGDNLKYSSYKNSFKLYSIGPNMKDDNGTQRMYNYKDSAYNDYDIVWKCES